jgi:hypothetical protein
VDPSGGGGFGNRTFWTAAIPESDVTIHFGAGTAELKVSNLALYDYGNIPTALGPNFESAEAPAVVSFDAVWSGPITRRLSVTDSADVDQFTGQYEENQATVTWSGTNLATGFSFTANPGDFSTSAPGRAFAELAQEQNGAFFSPGGSKGGAIAPSLIQVLPLPSAPNPTMAAPLVPAALPAAHESPASIVTTAQNYSLAIPTADPGGSDSRMESLDLGGEPLFH